MNIVFFFLICKSFLIKDGDKVTFEHLSFPSPILRSYFLIKLKKMTKELKNATHLKDTKNGKFLICWDHQHNWFSNTNYAQQNTNRCGTMWLGNLENVCTFFMYVCVLTRRFCSVFPPHKWICLSYEWILFSWFSNAQTTYSVGGMENHPLASDILAAFEKSV